MPPNIALLLGAIIVTYAFRSDRSRTGSAIPGTFWPTLWYLVVATRPFGYWLAQLGIPLPGGSGDPTEGSLLDRSFFAALAVVGCGILFRRRIRLRSILRANSWLVALLCLMALSILWSQYPYVSFKRYVKIVGSIVMALVVLTSAQPFECAYAVLRRCLYVHLPMSIVCIKYFRHIGVAYDWSGSGMWWQGISTTKNTLGQVAMLGLVYFSFEIYRNWARLGWRTLYVPYLLMAAFLLKGGTGAVSMTSVSVGALAMIVFAGIQALREHPALVNRFVYLVFGGVIGLVALILTHSLVHFSPDSIFGQAITTFGRDITLTDRTYIWSDIYGIASDHSLFGVGFGGFWIGRLANIPWNATMTWALGQGHNGYIDTYLQIGIAGSILLTGVVLSAMPKLLGSLADDFDFGCFRITLFVTILFINITETTFLRGDHHLWMLLMVVLLNIPTSAAPPTYCEST